jgi:hypothetical protein
MESFIATLALDASPETDSTSLHTSFSDPTEDVDPTLLLLSAFPDSCSLGIRDLGDDRRSAAGFSGGLDNPVRGSVAGEGDLPISGLGFVALEADVDVLVAVLPGSGEADFGVVFEAEDAIPFFLESGVLWGLRKPNAFPAAPSIVPGFLIIDSLLCCPDDLELSEGVVGEGAVVGGRGDDEETPAAADGDDEGVVSEGSFGRGAAVGDDADAELDPAVQ